MYPLWKVDSSNQNYKGNILLRTKYFNISFYLSENKSGKALLKHETSRCCDAIMFLQADTLRELMKPLASKGNKAQLE